MQIRPFSTNYIFLFFSVILDIFLKQIALESFLLQLVVGLSVL
jgi:hypothetical protein